MSNASSKTRVSTQRRSQQPSGEDERKHGRFDYQGARFQVALLGILAAGGPGFYNGLFGYAGGSDAHTRNVDVIASALTYGFLGVVSLLGGVLICIMDLQLLLTYGGLSYGVFAILMQVARLHEHLYWLACIAGIVLGIGAAFFWVVSCALVLAYAPEERRGLYIAIFWGLFNFGATIAAILDMVVVTTTGVTGDNAIYWTLIVVTTLISLGVPRLISDPHSVKAETVIIYRPPDATAESIHDEASHMLRVFAIPEMIMMSLLYIGSIWTQSYHTTFIVYHLNTPSLATLLQLVQWIVQMCVPFLLSGFIDGLAEWSLRRKGLWFFHGMAILWVITWVAAVSFQYTFEGGYDKDWPIEQPIHWNTPKRAIKPILLAMLFAASECVTQVYIFWFLSLQTHHDVMLAIRYTGYFKGLQSLGNAVSWAIDLFPRNTYRFQLWLCISHFLLDLPLTFIAAINLHSMKSGDPGASAKTPILHMPLI